MVIITLSMIIKFTMTIIIFYTKRDALVKNTFNIKKLLFFWISRMFSWFRTNNLKCNFSSRHEQLQWCIYNSRGEWRF